jgi:membrane-bound serine protease (ClpP class)
MVLQAPGAGTVTASGPVPTVGARGRSLSALRPAGNAEFDGALTDVVSDGAFIPAHVDVEVVAVEGERITVRAAPQAGGGSA